MELRLGAFAKSIWEQLPDLKDHERFQKIADAITVLALHGYLQPSLVKNYRDKLINEIRKELDE